MTFEHVLMFSSSVLNLKNKFKLKSIVSGNENKTSPQRFLFSNMFMVLAKLHVNIPAEYFINIHTLLDKLAIAPGDSAALLLPLVILKSTGACAIA